MGFARALFYVFFSVAVASDKGGGKSKSGADGKSQSESGKKDLSEYTGVFITQQAALLSVRIFRICNCEYVMYFDHDVCL